MSNFKEEIEEIGKLNRFNESMLQDKIKYLDKKKSNSTQLGTIIRFNSKESICSSCDFLDLETLSENETSFEELSKISKEANLVSNCSSHLDEYLDTYSKSMVSRNSSLISIESITFDKNKEYRSQRFLNNSSICGDDVCFDSPLGMNVKVCTENEIFKNLNKEFSNSNGFVEQDKKSGFLSNLSTKFWNLEESFSLSKFDSINGIKTFLLEKIGHQGSLENEQETTKHQFLGQNIEDGYIFFANPKSGYDSQRSESDTSEESIRYPLFSMDEDFNQN